MMMMRMMMMMMVMMMMMIERERERAWCREHDVESMVQKIMCCEGCGNWDDVCQVDEAKIE